MPFCTFCPELYRGFLVTGNSDKVYMERVLSLAEKGRLTTSPNPMVGAVIVRNGRIVGEGYHRAPGLPHAEKNAIEKAAGRTRGATMYVNIEPCCHIGRTGPCSEAILKSGLKRVVYALKDPDPRVNGRGVSILRRAGLEVECGPLRKKARLQNDRYFGFHRNGRPFTILKMAQTLDGRIAAADGSSRWISSRQSRTFAHRLRAEVDAVIVGMGTVRADNPALTVRNVKGGNPYRIVMSRSLSFPSHCRLLNENADYKTIIATTGAAAERFARKARGRNLIYWELKTDRRKQLDPADLLSKAAGFGIQRPGQFIPESGACRQALYDNSSQDSRLRAKLPWRSRQTFLGHGFGVHRRVI